MRNREGKQGGGVMLLVKKGLTVESIEYGKGEAEVLRVSLKKYLGRCQ